MELKDLIQKVADELGFPLVEDDLIELVDKINPFIDTMKRMASEQLTNLFASIFADDWREAHRMLALNATPEELTVDAQADLKLSWEIATRREEIKQRAYQVLIAILSLILKGLLL